MSPVYIFGIGSPFGADRLGWMAVERLRARFADNPHVLLNTLSQPADIFTHLLEPAAQLIFIDAMISGRTPGSVQSFDARQLVKHAHQTSSHGFDLKTAIDLLEGLGFPSDRIRVFGVEMTADELVFNDAVQTVCTQIVTFVEQLEA